MLNIASSDLRTLVLIKLTKSIIENSESYAMFKLEKMLSSGGIESIPEKKIDFERLRIEEVKQAKEIKKEKIKRKVKKKLGYTPSIMNPRNEEQAFFVPPARSIFKTKTPLQIKHKPTSKKRPPEIKPPQNKPLQRIRISRDDLPEHLKYLRPTRTDIPRELELGKLVPFLKDRNVKTIEIEGPDQVIYVKGTMGKKPTGEKLTAEEIDQILDTFSKVGKVPKVEGLFKVATSNLILTAMVSESIGSRFIIKKM